MTGRSAKYSSAFHRHFCFCDVYFTLENKTGMLYFNIPVYVNNNKTATVIGQQMFNQLIIRTAIFIIVIAAIAASCCTFLYSPGAGGFSSFFIGITQTGIFFFQFSCYTIT